MVSSVPEKWLSYRITRNPVLLGGLRVSPDAENEPEGVLFIQGVCVHCQKMRGEFPASTK